MSKNEILAMEPGNKLDALIAEKIIGFKIYQGHGKKYIDGLSISAIPEYSKSIAAAWEVVEKMYELGFKYCINILDDWRFEKPTQHCCFAESDYTDGLYIKDSNCFHAYGDTTAEVVCKAALLAVGEASND